MNATFTKVIKHHDPSYGYNLLFTSKDYPARKFRPFCSHEFKQYECEDADPGFMQTSYIHEVCIKCGKLKSSHIKLADFIHFNHCGSI